ncbi:DUF1778 domain-containing protein [Thioalkalivibrio sp. ALMg11]|uniref:type II toxin-antitoxin system TacA family antitoxin n=1 Tax=Thioalkalivibrio sp. ALMg11 TaxID=1158165 RepID=UPI0004773134|nr:DUF1778 domain-containing protein [Thioalkalivibrio sp. ALMg11]
MNPVNEQPNEGDERNDARMHFRTRPRIKQAIHRAASLAGMDDSSFVINAAYHAALATIATHERTVLSAEDHAAFFAALDEPPEPTEALREAARRSRARTVSG